MPCIVNITLGFVTGMVVFSLIVNSGIKLTKVQNRFTYKKMYLSLWTFHQDCFAIKYSEYSQTKSKSNTNLVYLRYHPAGALNKSQQGIYGKTTEFFIHLISDLCYEHIDILM